MNNEDKQFENLENLNQEELDTLEAELDHSEEKEEEDSTPTIDYKARAEAAERKAATLQRLLNKKSEKTINKTNQDDYSQDIREIKQNLKIENFADEHNLTKAQAKKLFEVNPNPTADTLKDPFIAEGLKALARKDRISNAMPQGGRVSTVGGKSFKEMNEDERRANYAKLLRG